MLFTPVLQFESDGEKEIWTPGFIFAKHYLQYLTMAPATNIVYRFLLGDSVRIAWVWEHASNEFVAENYSTVDSNLYHDFHKAAAKTIHDSSSIFLQAGENENITVLKRKLYLVNEDKGEYVDLRKCYSKEALDPLVYLTAVYRKGVVDSSEPIIVDGHWAFDHICAQQAHPRGKEIFINFS